MRQSQPSVKSLVDQVESVYHVSLPGLPDKHIVGVDLLHGYEHTVTHRMTRLPEVLTNRCRGVGMADLCDGREML